MDLGRAARARRRARRRPRRARAWSAGDTVALMLANRPEFHLSDLAVMMVGATPFSIYSTYAPEQIRYLVIDADAQDRSSPSSSSSARCSRRARSCPTLEHVIVVDGDAPEGVARARRRRSGSTPTSTSRRRWRRSGPQRRAHAHLHLGHDRPAQGRAALAPQPARRRRAGSRSSSTCRRDGRVISWLPSAHVAERNAHHYLPIVYGLQITCCDDPREVLGYLPEVRPSWFFAVPRIWEKLKAGPGDDGRRPARRAARDDARPPCATRPRRCASSSAARRSRPSSPSAVAAGRRRDLRRAARDARPRPGRGDQRRRRADAGRGARVLPRDRPAARPSCGG